MWTITNYPQRSGQRPSSRQFTSALPPAHAGHGGGLDASSMERGGIDHVSIATCNGVVRPAHKNHRKRGDFSRKTATPPGFGSEYDDFGEENRPMWIVTNYPQRSEERPPTVTLQH